MGRDKKKEKSSMLDSPETMTKRIQGNVIRGVQDEERRAEKALSLLKARDRKIASLERKIVKLKNRADGDPRRVVLPEVSVGNTSLGNSSNKETTYLSIPPTEGKVSRGFTEDVEFEKSRNFIDEITKLFRDKDNVLKKSIMSFESMKNTETTSTPDSTTPASVSLSNSEADMLENVKSDLNRSSSFTSSEFCHDDSSVNLVVTAALAFSKFDDVQCGQANDCAKVSRDKAAANDNEDKKRVTEKSSKKNLVPTRLSTSLPGIKTRRLWKHRKRGFVRKVEKTLGNVSRNAEKAVTRMIESPQKTTQLPRAAGKSETDVWHAASAVQEQRLEDKGVGVYAQETALNPDRHSNSRKNGASSQDSHDSDDKLNEPMKIMNSSESKNNLFMGRKQFLGTWSPEDEPAPQWLIEEALKRGEESTENHRAVNSKAESMQNDDKDTDSLGSKDENIINDLEKQLCTTRSELAQALNEQLNIKNKYKRALKEVKTAAEEERDRLHQKIVQICTLIFEKFGPQARSSRKTTRTCHVKLPRPLQHFGKLSKKVHRKLRIANQISSRLKQELESTKKQLEEKSQQYDSMMKCFSTLKSELKSAESSMNDLLNENNLLRKKIEDTREWVYTRVNKERNEKINTAQFREIQRSRELANLKKKSEEDIATIAQLRGKLFRLESANSNKAFLLNNYKGQLADLTKEKDILSNRIKELEIDNSSLRTTNAQLRANLALINEEKEKLSTESEKSEMDVRDQMSMQSELATKCEQSMRQRIETMRAEYDRKVEGMETKLSTSQSAITEYREAIKRFLKKIDEYNEELDTERDFSCSEASEREAHETACEILNITRGELTGFLKGHLNNKINSWLSEVSKITAKKCFAENLGRFLFEKAISHTKR